MTPGFRYGATWHFWAIGPVLNTSRELGARGFALHLGPFFIALVWP